MFDKTSLHRVSLRKSIARDPLIDHEALADPELSWKVHQAKAVTLMEALDTTVEVFLC